MVQKAARSEASLLNSLGPIQDWLEVCGEVLRPTLLSHGPENPEEKEIALSLRKWAEQNRNIGFSSRPSSGRRSSAVFAIS